MQIIEKCSFLKFISKTHHGELANDLITICRGKPNTIWSHYSSGYLDVLLHKSTNTYKIYTHTCKTCRHINKMYMDCTHTMYMIYMYTCKSCIDTVHACMYMCNRGCHYIMSWHRKWVIFIVTHLLCLLGQLHLTLYQDTIRVCPELKSVLISNQTIYNGHDRHVHE